MTCKHQGICSVQIIALCRLVVITSVCVSLFIVQRVYEMSMVDQFDPRLSEASSVYRISPNSSLYSGTGNLNYDQTKPETVLNGTTHPDSVGDRIRTPVFHHEDKRKDSCDGCFAVEYDYLVNNEHICKSQNSAEIVDVILVIFSSPERTAQRQALRNAWLLPVRHNKGPVRYMFLLGAEISQDHKANILLEKLSYGDIVQSNIVDDYSSLTYKSVIGLQWVANYCNNSRFYMKTDDDCWVNTDKLADILIGKRNELDGAIGGVCVSHKIPTRSVGQKWYTSYQDFPRSEFPPYCIGMGYVMNMKTVARILLTYSNVPPFLWEDIYVGLVGEQLGLKTVDIPGFVSDYRTTNLCTFKTDIIVIHLGTLISPDKLKQIWLMAC